MTTKKTSKASNTKTGPDFAREAMLNVRIPESTLRALKKRAEKETEGNVSILVRSILRGCIG